jgi:hypothetical protein
MEKKISGSIWSMLHLSLFLLLIAIGMLAPSSHAVDDKCAACKAVAVTSLFSFIPNRFIFHSAFQFFNESSIIGFNCCWFDLIRFCFAGRAGDWTFHCIHTHAFSLFYFNSVHLCL